MTTKTVNFGEVELWNKNYVEFKDINYNEDRINKNLVKFIREFVWPGLYQTSNELWVAEYKHRIRYSDTFDFDMVEQLFLDILIYLQNGKHFVLDYRKLIIINKHDHILLSKWYINVYKNPQYCAMRINRMIWRYIIRKRCKKRSRLELFVISKTSANKIKMLRQVSTGIYKKLSKNIHN